MVHLTTRPLYFPFWKKYMISKILSTSLFLLETLLVEKMGSVSLDKHIKLHNVLFVPSFNCNLISIFRLTHDLKCIVTYYADHCEIHDWTVKRRIGLGELHDGVYVMKRSVKGQSFSALQGDSTAV